MANGDVFGELFFVSITSGDKDILSIENGTNLINSGFTVIYKKEKAIPHYDHYDYGKYKDPSTPDADYHGGCIRYNEEYDRAFIYLGPFPGSKSYNETVTIDYGDGRSDKIRIVHKYKDYNTPGKRDLYKTKIYLNDKEVETFPYVFIKR